jgi:hypothetical protein
MPELSKDWLDLAFFLPLGESPGEFDVILCRSVDVAEDTAKLLNLRLSAIKSAKSTEKYSEMIKNAKVTVIGNYALLIISGDTKTALKIFSKTCDSATFFDFYDKF